VSVAGGEPVPNIPTDVQGYTTEWFNTVLAERRSGVQVTGSVVTEHGTPGQTAEVYSATLSYDRPDTDLPARMIIKAASRNPGALGYAENLDLYRREVAFYTECDGLGIPVPDCYYAAHEADPQRMVLLLEDLAPSESPSWAISPAQVRVAAGALPSLHARWWNDPELRDRDWLGQPDDADSTGAFYAVVLAAIPGFQEHLGDSCRESVRVVETLAGKVDRVLAYLATRDHTLVHGDYHGGQMFFPVASGGRFAVIDWQSPSRAQGAWDLARISSLGLATPERRKIGSELLAGYHDGLVSAGVRDYSREELLDDFRIGLAVSQMVMINAIANTPIEIVAMECEQLGLDWKELWAGRGEACLRDYRVLELARAL
jgi:hypothetical protein